MMEVVQGINKLEQLPCFHLIWELMFDIIDAGFSLDAVMRDGGLFFAKSRK